MPQAEPTPEVMAIMVAAVDAVWPRTVVVSGPRRREERAPSWRFSGRPWNAPVAANRNRPTF
ncbi:MAG TPA: hypothetical protein VMZ22_10515 [Acidimicrobiales bacterium]|nr:hypothetical protein [Acidimicrobiales bacterium]